MDKDKPNSRTIRADYLARVEGEGALFLAIQNQQLTEVKLKIFEPPRLFEGFLQGRHVKEAPDITARICGICPVAYQMSAVHAIENALGVTVSEPIRSLRRLLYCGEWISSHGLHIYMLHAPDFLGYESAIHMAQDFPQEVQRGLQLKKLGGALMSLVGGREIHPINVKVGGFYQAPAAAKVKAMIPEIETARKQAVATLQWAAQFQFPEFHQPYHFVALNHPNEYPMNEGDLVSNQGLRIKANEFSNHFAEVQVPHSNAHHCVHLPNNSAYHVGPMARYGLNFHLLPPSIQQLAQQAGLGASCSNPFKSILVRCIEVIYACEEALRIAQEYQEPTQACMDIQYHACEGYAITEAPRGLLYHYYKMDDEGLIIAADIIPPTSQNQKMIEEDLWQFIPQLLHLSDDQLQWQAEQAIRNYDPCISCATHFLQLEVKRS